MKYLHGLKNGHRRHCTTLRIGALIACLLFLVLSKAIAQSSTTAGDSENDVRKVERMRAEQIELRAQLIEKIEAVKARPDLTPAEQKRLAQLQDLLKQLDGMINSESKRKNAEDFGKHVDVGKELLYCAQLQVSFKKLSMGAGHEYELFKASTLAEVKPIAILLIAEDQYDVLLEQERGRAWSEARGKLENEIRFGGVYKPYVEERRQYCKDVRTHSIWLTAP